MPLQSQIISPMPFPDLATSSFLLAYLTADVDEGGADSPFSGRSPSLPPMSMSTALRLPLFLFSVVLLVTADTVDMSRCIYIPL